MVLCLIVLKRLTVVLHLTTTLATFLLLHALFELPLQRLFTVHRRVRLISPLRCLVELLRTFVRIMALLLAIEADDAHILHLTHRVHHLNITKLRLGDLLFLTISRFVAIFSTSVANDPAFILSHVVLPTMHRLREMYLAVHPIFFQWEVC